MLEFFKNLFNADFMPHGHCYYWRSEIVGLHVISDGLTALAYYAIPFALVTLARKRRDLSFNGMFWLFSMFILACGTTHLMAIWTLWHPVYRLEGVIKAITALASVPTAVLLTRLLPQAIALPSPVQLREANSALELEVTERRRAEASLAGLNADLERRVAERTAELERTNQDLRQRTTELEALLTHAPIGFAFFDREHRYTRINQALCEINGLPEAAHLGRAMIDVLSVNRSTDPIVAEVFRTGRIVESEVSGETPKEPGLTRHWLTGFFPIQERDQPVSAVGVFVLEISERKRWEEELRASKERYALAEEATTDGLWDWNQATRECYVSPQGRALLGFGQELVTGQELYSRIHPEDVAGLNVEVSKQLVESLTGDFELRLRHRDESYRWFRARSTVVRDGGGVAVRLVGSISDITERKRAERNAALLSAIVNSSEDAILSKDMSGVITSWNRGAERLFGYTENEAMGRNVAILIPEERLGEENDILDRLQQGERVNHFETVRQRKDGTRLHISLTLSPLTDGNGNIVGGSKIARDITDRVKNREELNAANRDLRIANEGLNQFAFAAAHDLREPLRNVRAYAEFLANICPEGPDEKIDWAKTVIAEGVQRMSDLLSGLLEYTSLGAMREAAVTGVECGAAVQHAVRNLQQTIEESGAQVECGDLPLLPGNEPHYVQLFQNLIGNAIKYRGEEPPRIVISAQAKEGEWLFSVRDNGMGIAEEYHGRIFGVFKRLHGKEIPGTGIGLAICQKIVERYGGRIWVESELGKGCEFFFTIPHVAERMEHKEQK